MADNDVTPGADTRQSALAAFWAEGRAAEFETSTISLREDRTCHKLILRGDGTDVFARTVEACTGSPLPADDQALSVHDPCCLKLADNEWLIASTNRPALDRELAASLHSSHARIFNADSAWVRIRLSGSAANRLLARGCNQDFHPSKFSVGRFCHTEIARIPVIIFQRDDRNDFDIYVDRSLAMDAWLWLRDTAREMT